MTVYFFAFEGRIKVGYTANWENRLAFWRKQLGDKIEIIGTIPGGLDAERSAHKLLEKNNVGGEWFRDHVLAENFVTCCREIAA